MGSPPSGRLQIGTLAGFASEYPAGFNRNPQFLAAAIGEGPGTVGLMPVQITNDSAPSSTSSVPPPSSSDEHRIEIKLPSGVEISIGKDVDVEALRRVLLALAG